MIPLFLIAVLFMFGLMSVTWLVYRKLDRADIVDLAWAFGLATLAVLYAVVGEGWWVRKVLVAAMAGLWGYRLAFHLLGRIRTHGEDGHMSNCANNGKPPCLDASLSFINTRRFSTSSLSFRSSSP